MNDSVATRIYRQHYHLIKQLSPADQGRVLVALCDYVFQNVFQNEIQIENQFDFNNPLAKSIFETIAPLMRVHTNNAGGGRAGAGRPRKSGNVQKIHTIKNDNPKNQNKIQIENQFDKFDFDDSARVSDNINNNINNTRKSPLVLLPNGNIQDGIKERPPTKWELFAIEWNRIAGLYHRPKVRYINSVVQKMVTARCRENHLTLNEFLQICEKALKLDKNLRCGTDTWRGADLTYFGRPLNFQRAMETADNGIISNSEISETAQVLKDFINGGNQ